jgi:hypothetical protein
VIRIVRDGIAFECDDVASAIELADALKPQPLLPLVAPRRVKVKAAKTGKATPPMVRGASSGALDGEGKVRAEGATLKRRWMLVGAKPRQKK